MLSLNLEVVIPCIFLWWEGHARQWITDGGQNSVGDDAVIEGLSTHGRSQRLQDLELNFFDNEITAVGADVLVNWLLFSPFTQSLQRVNINLCSLNQKNDRQ